MALLAVTPFRAFGQLADSLRAAVPEIGITGDANPALAPFDNLITFLMQKYDIPGAQLAVTKNGRLVLAHGYGWADSGNNVTVQPVSRFRIASLSKQLTSIAVLQLVQQRKLGLDDRPFAILTDILPLPGAVKDPRLMTITVRNLLQHSGGWDRNASGDPMFDSLRIAQAVGVPSPPSTRDIIRYMLGRPLDFTPGTKYVYSNFGYAVLGRVVEKITGVAYDQYVRSNVLAPVGVTEMQIGETLTAFRQPGEVSYYLPPRDGNRMPIGWAQSVFASSPGNLPWPYGGFCLEAMDSHGGWLASAIDLLKFWNGIDGRRGTALLNSASLQQMTARPNIPDWANTSYWYGMGFLIRPSGGDANWWHDGSLAGTRTWTVRTNDGYAWSALFNERPSTERIQGRPSQDDLFVTELDSGLWNAKAAVTNWPATDLFPAYPSATVTLGNLVVMYDGTSKPVAATTNPAGLAVTLTYNGSSIAPTAAGPYAVVATINDLHYTGSATGTLVISQTNPPGTLVTAPGSPFPLGYAPVSVAVGDFNGDGKPDLAVANLSSVMVLLGNGSGGFTMAPGSPFAQGSHPVSVAVGDFNGDGKLDFAVANAYTNNVAVLLGNGSGGFTAAPGSPFAIGRIPVSVTVGDFDLDGKQDLAIAYTGGSNPGGVMVLLGSGLGGFTVAAGGPFAVGVSPRSVAMGDFNGDGRPDLAVANSYSQNVTVLLGNGSGGFTAAPGSPFAAGSVPYSVAVGDFNGDGRADLAVANLAGNNVTVLLGNGLGGFTAAPGSPVAAGSAPYSVAVGDFNSDGKPDLAVADWSGLNVTVLLGNGSGGFTAGPGSPFATQYQPVWLAVGDFNGDGRADLAVATINGNTLRVLLSTGVQQGDVNGDGKVDCTDLGRIEAIYHPPSITPQSGVQIGAVSYNARADVNFDGVINYIDVGIVTRLLPPTSHCPVPR